MATRKQSSPKMTIMVRGVDRALWRQFRDKAKADGRTLVALLEEALRMKL